MGAPAARGLGDHGHGRVRVRARGEQQAVVEAGRVAQQTRRLQARADAGGVAEVEHRACHAGQFARGHALGVGDGVAVGGDREAVRGQARAAGTGEVVEAVVGEVDHGGRVGRGRVVDVEGVLAAHQAVSHLHRHRAGEVLVAGGADEREHGTERGGVRKIAALPDAPVEAIRVAMQMHAFGVRHQGDGVAVERELGVADAAGVAAHDGAVAAAVGLVRGQRWQAQHHVDALAVAIGQRHFGQGGAVVDVGQAHAARVLHAHPLDVAAVARDAPVLHVDVRVRRCGAENAGAIARRRIRVRARALVRVTRRPVRRPVRSHVTREHARVRAPQQQGRREKASASHQTASRRRP